MTSKKPIQFTCGLVLLCIGTFMVTFLLAKGIYYALGIDVVKALLGAGVAAFVWCHARQRRGAVQE